MRAAWHGAIVGDVVCPSIEALSLLVGALATLSLFP